VVRSIHRHFRNEPEHLRVQALCAGTAAETGRGFRDDAGGNDLKTRPCRQAATALTGNRNRRRCRSVNERRLTLRDRPGGERALRHGHVGLQIGDPLGEASARVACGRWVGAWRASSPAIETRQTLGRNRFEPGEGVRVRNFGRDRRLARSRVKTPEGERMASD